MLSFILNWVTCSRKSHFLSLLDEISSAELFLPPPSCRVSGNGVMTGSVRDAVWLEFSHGAIIFASYGRHCKYIQFAHQSSNSTLASQACQLSDRIHCRSCQGSHLKKPAWKCAVDQEFDHAWLPAAGDNWVTRKVVHHLSRPQARRYEQVTI